MVVYCIGSMAGRSVATRLMPPSITAKRCLRIGLTNLQAGRSRQAVVVLAYRAHKLARRQEQAGCSRQAVAGSQTCTQAVAGRL